MPSLLVAVGVVLDGMLAVLAAGDARLDPLVGEGLAEPCFALIIAAIGDDYPGVPQGWQDGGGPAIVADLAFCQKQD